MKRSDTNIVQTAKERLAAVEAERAELVAFLATAEKLIGTGADSAPQAIPQPDSRPPTPARELRKRAAAILSAVGRPMPLAELHDRLVRAGVVIGGKDPRSNLSAKLSGAPEVQTIPGEGWVIRQDEHALMDGEAA